MKLILKLIILSQYLFLIIICLGAVNCCTCTLYEVVVKINILFSIRWGEGQDWLLYLLHMYS